MDKIDKIINGLKKSFEGTQEEPIRVRYELFRDAFRNNMHKAVVRAKWSEIVGGVYNTALLVDGDGNIVATTPPIMNAYAEVESSNENDSKSSLGGKYEYAKMKDNNINRNAVEAVFKDYDISGTDAYIVGKWRELYSIIDNLSDPAKEEVEEDAGYEL